MCIRLAIAPVLACALLLASGLSAAEPATVPKDVATTLTAAQQENDPVLRLAILSAHNGSEHALIELMRAQAELSIAETDAAQRSGHLTLAQTAFTKAAELDPQLRQAYLGLAHVAALHDDWRAAVNACARVVTLGDPTESELFFYTNAAWQTRDWRLAQTLISQGIVRYPNHDGFRRLELAALVEGGRPEEAHQATLALLATHSDEHDLWRHLAWSAQKNGSEAESLAALEIALLQKPEDRELRLRLARSQLVGGMPRAARDTMLPLLADPAACDDPTLEFAVRAAAECGDLAQARNWLTARPEAQRPRAQRLLAARLALQADDQADAVRAVKSLIELGENDPQVLAWSGQVCETAGDDAAAEAFYGLAAGSDHSVASAATVRLAALYVRQERQRDAEALLAAHLVKHPDDAQARAMQQRLKSHQERRN